MFSLLLKDLISDFYLHILNTKQSDFNQIFVHSLSDEPINIA